MGHLAGRFGLPGGAPVGVGHCVGHFVGHSTGHSVGRLGGRLAGHRLLILACCSLVAACCTCAKPGSAKSLVNVRFFFSA